MLCKFWRIYPVAACIYGAWEPQTGRLVIVPRAPAETETKTIPGPLGFVGSDDKRQLVDPALYERHAFINVQIPIMMAVTICRT